MGYPIRQLCELVDHFLGIAGALGWYIKRYPLFVNDEKRKTTTSLL